MTFANPHLSYRGGDKPKSGFRPDWSAARHFVGIFAVGFSGTVLYTIAHFVFCI